MAGGLQFEASQLWGRTWEGGDVTLTYEWLNRADLGHNALEIHYGLHALGTRQSIRRSALQFRERFRPAQPGQQRQRHCNVGTVCGNCFAIPKGTGGISANFGAGLISSKLTAGTTNELGTAEALGWEDAAQQKNSIVGTFDQRLFPGVSFFFTGFYTNRRVENQEPPFYTNGVPNAINTLTVPTTNPYYPTNAPARPGSLIRSRL